MIQYTKKTKCSNCGKCPKQLECVYMPDDFSEVSFNTLLEAYEQGRLIFQAVYMDGELVGLTVRPPYEQLLGVIFSGAKEAVCKFWSGNGCTLEKKYLPEKKRNILDSLIQWTPYMVDVVEEVALHVMAIEKKKNEKYFDHDQCAMCKGECCRGCGCYFSPSDFKKLSVVALRNIMQRGFVTITAAAKSCTGLKEDVLVLRIRNKDESVVNLSGNHQEGCILHDLKTGCPFEDDDRPYGAKVLIPERFTEGRCSRGYSQRQCAEDWLPYQDILKQLKNEFDGKDIGCLGIC